MSAFLLQNGEHILNNIMKYDNKQMPLEHRIRFKDVSNYEQTQILLQGLIQGDTYFPPKQNSRYFGTQYSYECDLTNSLFENIFIKIGYT